MSVIGIDFGNESCFVAVARAGGIETVDNDYSLRATSSTVAFGEKQRILGVPAKNQLVTNIKNTVWGFKRFLGRQFDDPKIQEEMRSLPFQMVPFPQTGGVAIQTRYLGDSHVFSVEQIAGMLFTKLKETTEHAVLAKVSDCVISVPSYFTDIERRALHAAATMAGFNVLRLLNETTATALNYGIYKQDLPEPDDKPRNVIFVDCGHSALQISACAFNKGKLKMLASTADPYLGGRDFDKVLAEHFCVEFRQKYGIDTHSNHRAYVRLLTEVEKLKKQMSANATKLPLNIECLMDDKDVTSSMCRADFEAMSASLIQRVEVTMQNCLRDSKLQLDDIYSVEIVGGSSRVPAVKQLIEKIFGKAPSTTLNQDEAVARGCALQCAILSPAYKVRDFGITDVQPYPIKLVWDETLGEDGSTEVFPQYHPVPFSRMLTFYKRDPFCLKAVYNSAVPYPTQKIGTYAIKNVQPPDGQVVKIKVKARVNINGVFSISSATAYEKLDSASEESLMETEPPQTTQSTDNTQAETSQEPANANANANGQENAEAGNDAPMSQDEPGPDHNSDKKKEEKAKKSQYKTIDLPVETTICGLTPQDVDLMTETEGKMIAEDKREKERIDAKNALEEFVYLLRDKLEGDLAPFVEGPQKAELSQTLGFLENWLYEDGSDENRQAYTEKLQSLKKTADPIFERRIDHNERPGAIRELEISIQLARKVIDMYRNKEARYEHLDIAEIDKLDKAIGESQAWLDHTREILHSVQLFMTSPIKAAEIIQHRKMFETVSHPIINKPKPKAQPPPKEEVKPAENNEGSNTNNAGNHAEPQQQEMDVE